MIPKRIDPDITVEVDGLAWTRVESLRRARPDERVYAVIIEEDGIGELRFGDGQRGLRPPANSTVKVTYRTGGGVVGSVSRVVEDARDEPRFWMMMKDGAGAVGWQTVERARGRGALSALACALGMALAIAAMLGLAHHDRDAP
ncbi:MAG: hypothetical protein Q8P98_04810 [Candidatus Rokubacteria bacterium]|nr:hypothetical protein [Candidatus Rokubacteria bacterium]